MFWKSPRNTRRIYLDAAAATPISPAAQKELVRLLGVYGNPGALHKEAVMAKAELDRARETVATAIGAHADEIIFTSGGTEGNNLALSGVIRPLLREGKKVHAITSVIEHPSVLEPLRALVAEGLVLTELPVDESGLVSPKDVADAMTDDTVLVSIQMVNSEIGTIEPIHDIAKEIRYRRKERLQRSDLCKQLYFHCDASQAPLWVRLAVDKLGVDLLTLDGQKIMGPKGIGALYVRRGVRLEAQSRGGGQEKGRRGGTENAPLAASFAIALHDAQLDIERTVTHTSAVRDFLLNEILRLLPEAQVNGVVGESRACNNLNISIPKLDGEMAVIALSAEGVAASTRSACDSSDEQPSHVLVALGLDASRTKSAIRLTLLPTTTARDASQAAQKLFEIAQRYRTK